LSGTEDALAETFKTQTGDFLELEGGTLDFGTVDFGQGVARGATISGDDRQYRYDLYRRWDDEPTLGWLMLNPSTADALVDDATIRRCVAIAKRDGYGGIVVRNLYAFRTMDPDVLFAQSEEDRVGPDNDDWIVRLREDAHKVVAAWGHEAGKRAAKRVKTVRRMCARNGIELFCVGRTQDGSPRHPLYVKKDAELTEFA
jgi:hypothetical protein